MTKINVIGAGLAGCEASFQLLKRGYCVDLYEMRGIKQTPCHKTDNVAELVCSNSLKSQSLDTGSGMLKAELQKLDSLLLECGVAAKVPAGGALAVDREVFSKLVFEKLSSFNNFNLIREEVLNIETNTPTIVASGPLTSDGLSEAISNFVGQQYLHFYDAVAPIVSAESIDMSKAFFAARYDKGESDYLNCALDKEQYLAFWNALVTAQRAPLHDFDNNIFEGCMPIEIMAARGVDTMRFGPMRPVGITNVNDGTRPYAVVQLRKENVEGTIYNIVGFQTNLTFAEQRRVFAMIPSLENLEIVRYGVMHRNTFINAPLVINNTFASKKNQNVYFAGQITGVEGYMESVASGLVAAINLANYLENKEKFVLPNTTIMGQLQNHISMPCCDFQPMNANFGILPQLCNPSRDKKARKLQYSERGLQDMQDYLDKRS